VKRRPVGKGKGWLTCPECGRKVMREIPAGEQLPPGGKWFELAGTRVEFAPGAKFGESTPQGQTVMCPRKHPVSARRF